MKTNTLSCMAITFAFLATSCNEKRELTSQRARDAPEAVRQISDEGPGSSAALPSAEMRYDKLDADGFPVDPGLAMNSNKMSKNQRMELRQQPPPGYHVGEPLHPRFILGKANDISWRDAQDDNLKPGNKEAITELLGLTTEQLPSGIFDDYFVIRSPSRRRFIVLSGSEDSSFLFTAVTKGTNASSVTKIHGINFDDKRRGFIRWNSFVSDSVIVGILSDDGGLENLPSRQIIYIYDIDKTTLRRVKFPSDFLEEYGDLFIIDSVAPSAVLIKWDRGQQPMTLYLNP